MSPSETPLSPTASASVAPATRDPAPPADADWAAARDGAVFCPLPTLGVLAIDGADAQAFLQGQLSNDVRRLAPGEWQRTTYNSPKGRMLASLLLLAEAGGGYRALLAAELAASVRKRLAMYVLRSKVTVMDVSSSVGILGIAGPRAADVVRSVLGASPEGGRALAQEDVRVLAPGADRFLVFGPHARLEELARAFGAQARRVPEPVWRWLQIRAGVPLVTAATQDALVLQSANLDVLGAVSFDKGCYTGQEIVARAHYLGRLKERMQAWHADVPDVAAGARVYSAVFGDQACGTVVNAAPAPGGGTDCLAVVQTAAVDSNDVHLDAPDGPALQRLPLPYTIPEPSQPKRPKL